MTVILLGWAATSHYSRTRIAPMRRASALAATTATTATMYIQLQVHRCRSQLQKETAQRQVDDQMAGLPVPACDAACDQIQQTNQRCARVELALGYAARPVKRRGALPRRLTIATQNIMDGCCLDSLIDEMLESQVVDVVDVLCVQENVITPRGKGGHHAGRLAWHLNHCCRSTERLQDGTDSDGSVDNLLCTRRQYHCHYHPEAPRLATVYDASQLDVVHSVLIRLPVLSPIPWHSRLIFSARAEPKHAILTVMRPRSNACVHGDDGATTVKSLGSVPEDIVVVNFHLDAMGDNEHRKNQVRWLVTELIRLGFASSAPSVVTGSHQLVLCGDTNIFAVGRKSQREALRDACTPLLDMGAKIFEGDLLSMPDTHFFSRANEPKWPQQAAVAMGRLGFDVPGTFDVVATNMPVIIRRQWTIASSDHDLVCATVLCSTGQAE